MINEARMKMVSDISESRRQMAKHRQELVDNGSWTKFDEIYRQYNEEIERLDDQIDLLLPSSISSNK